MRVKILCEINPREGETREQLEDRVDALLSHGTVRDSFDAADIDLKWIEVDELGEYERRALEEKPNG